MTQVLAAPAVVRCYFDEAFDPHLPVMCLRWDPADLDPPDQVWDLPENIRVSGPPPERFGVTIQRQGPDAYDVRLLWDRTCFHWQSLSRPQLLASALAPLLGALGTELWYLLDQPLTKGGVVSSQ